VSDEGKWLYAFEFEGSETQRTIASTPARGAVKTSFAQVKVDKVRDDDGRGQVGWSLIVTDLMGIQHTVNAQTGSYTLTSLDLDSLTQIQTAANLVVGGGATAVVAGKSVILTGKGTFTGESISALGEISGETTVEIEGLAVAGDITATADLDLDVPVAVTGSIGPADGKIISVAADTTLTIEDGGSLVLGTGTVAVGDSEATRAVLALSTGAAIVGGGDTTSIGQNKLGMGDDSSAYTEIFLVGPDATITVATGPVTVTDGVWEFGPDASLVLGSNALVDFNTVNDGGDVLPIKAEDIAKISGDGVANIKGDAENPIELTEVNTNLSIWTAGGFSIPQATATPQADGALTIAQGKFINVFVEDTPAVEISADWHTLASGAAPGPVTLANKNAAAAVEFTPTTGDIEASGPFSIAAGVLRIHSGTVSLPTLTAGAELTVDEGAALKILDSAKLSMAAPTSSGVYLDGDGTIETEVVWSGTTYSSSGLVVTSAGPAKIGGYVTKAVAAKNLQAKLTGGDGSEVVDLTPAE